LHIKKIYRNIVVLSFHIRGGSTARTLRLGLFLCPEINDMGLFRTVPEVKRLASLLWSLATGKAGQPFFNFLQAKSIIK